MDIEKLKLFNTLAETKQFNRAAELSHVSPSKLTRVIQQLESELNVVLFDRDNRSIELTHQGKNFLSFSRDTLQQWNTLRDFMQLDGDKLSGSISIYCSVTASYSFLYDILRDFRRAHPKIEIILHTGDAAPAIERVAAGFEDLAIAAKPDKLPSGLAFKSFENSPLVFIVSKEAADTFQQFSPEPDASWSNIPLILSERGIARDRFNRWIAKQEFTPNIYAQVAGHEAIVSMVSLGFGIGLVPKIVLDNSPLASRVELFHYQADIAPYNVGGCVLKKRLKSPLVAAFWRQIEKRP